MRWFEVVPRTKPKKSRFHLEYRNKAPIEYIEYYVYVGMSSKMYTMYSHEKGNYNYRQIAF